MLAGILSELEILKILDLGVMLVEENTGHL